MVLWLDRWAERCLDVEAARWRDRLLQELWPGLAAALAELPEPLASGFHDQSLAPPAGGAALCLRLFRSDDGYGVGLLQPRTAPDQVCPRVSLLANVINTVQDSLLITLAEPQASPGPIIIYVNQALEQQSGYRAQQLLGRSPRIFQGPDTDHTVTRRFGEELSQWHSPSMEVINYRQDGRPYWIDLKVAPLADADGWYTHWVSVQRDVSDRKADQQLLLDQAYTDPLTGLINRRGLYGLLDQLLAQSSCQIALIFCDLDRFKEVNDRYGHAVGDALLLELTNRLKSELRSHDHLARLGGDEFVVLMEGIHHDGDALALAERLRTALNEPWLHDGVEISLSMSMGLALAHAEPGMNPEELLRRADLTMYQVKESGRDGVAMYTMAMDSSVQAAVSLRQQLEGAVRHDRLLLHYQPLVNLATGQVVGAEALLRLRELNGGLVQPDHFIPVAERTGLITQLERWVINEALDTLAGWQQQGLSWSLAINISPVHLERGQLARELLEQQQRCGVDLAGLTVEITETVLLQAQGRAHHNLTALKAAGVSLALDDFGTGYSSLAWLSQLPIDKVKLDQAYIRQMGDDPRAATLLRGFTQVFQELGLTVVAEGIETVEQRQALLAMGCSLGQGFLYGRPARLDDPLWYALTQVGAAVQPT
jgi:diguanylate cyclase (GGDEF)-like protein/PAS domain S-box-containing protein